MTLRLALEGTDHATVSVASDHEVTLVSTRPFPPGATLRGSAPDPDLSPYAVKVKGCRRQAGVVPALFEVRGRFVNLTRAQRQELEQSGCWTKPMAP